MNENIAELIERTRTDEDFKQRVRTRGEKERARNYKPRYTIWSPTYQPGRTSARKAVKWAIKRGEISPARECLYVDKPNAHACDGALESFHYNGYEWQHRFDIVWVCRWHYVMLEKGHIALPSDFQAKLVGETFTLNRVDLSPIVRSSHKPEPATPALPPTVSLPSLTDNLKLLIERVNTDTDLQRNWAEYIIANERERERLLSTRRRLENRTVDYVPPRETKRHDPRLKAKAHAAVTLALKQGRLRRASHCEWDDCPTATVEAHHHLGYAPEHWLDVVWLCRKHHARCPEHR